MMNAEIVDVPVVERPMVFKLKRADGMGDSLNGIGLAVGEVVHRIDAPLISRSMMFRAQDPIHNGIAHVEVGRRHVDLRSQCTRPIGKLSRAHPRK